MLIPDEELRLLYQETSTTRLQKLQIGLLQLEQMPTNQSTLEDVRQELHGLKGDSYCLGLTPIAQASQILESVIHVLQQGRVGFTLKVSDCLYQGLYSVEQLVQTAITDDPDTLDITQILSELETAVAAVVIPDVSEDIFEDEPQPEPQPHSPFYIDDSELREIYRSTSEGRLQSLEAGLIQLEQDVATDDTLETLRREIHSLKGDSRAVGLDSMGSLIQLIEDVIKAVQSQALAFTPEVNRYVRHGLKTVEQLVAVATLGGNNPIDIDQTLEQFTLDSADLLALAATPPSADGALADGSTIDGDTYESEKDLVRLDNWAMPFSPETVFHAPEPLVVDQADAAAEQVDFDVDPDDGQIVDAELREIYRVTSVERLQRLEADLLQLEQQPQDTTALANLLRETHSLKGDARSAGVNAVETLAHALEDVLIGIQQQALTLDSAVSDRLYEGLDAIAHYVQTAVTGEPTDLELEPLLQKLRAAAPSGTTPDSDSTPDEVAPVPLPTPPMPDAPLPAFGSNKEKTTAVETIRVQTRDLEALTNQTEDLAVTRIQIAQTAVQTEQLLALWEEWQANKDQPRSVAMPAYEEQVEKLILNLRSTVQSNSSRLEYISEELRDRVRRLQLLPMTALFQPLRRMVRDLAKQQGKNINLVLEGEETTADKRLLDGIQDALLHLVRNAIDHGIEPPEERESTGKSADATLRVKTYQTAISLTIEVSDDGRGLDIDKIKQTAAKRKLHTPEELEAMPASQIQQLILAPGFSTRSFITEISGRGVGLDVVRSQVEDLKGAIQIESTPGAGCTFRLQLSTALSTANVVLVETQGMTFAIPIEFLETTVLISQDSVVNNGQDAMRLGDQTIPVANLVDTLELTRSPIYDWVAQPGDNSSSDRPCIVLKVGNDQAGFWVDRLLNNQEVIVKTTGSVLKRVRNVSGTTILGTGEVCMILNPADLLKSLQQRPVAAPVRKAGPQRKPTILLVEDSPPVRIQEKRLFEGAGYTVVTATNGLEGYHMLQAGGFDAVVSDVEMPELDGFSLVSRIRQQQEYSELPIILVTTLDSASDRQRGADAGANAYILKGRFNQEALLETLERLI